MAEEAPVEKRAKASSYAQLQPSPTPFRAKVRMTGQQYSKAGNCLSDYLYLKATDRIARLHFIKRNL